MAVFKQKQMKQQKMGHAKVAHVDPKPPCPGCGKPMFLRMVSVAQGSRFGKRPRKMRWCDDCGKGYSQRDV